MEQRLKADTCPGAWKEGSADTGTSSQDLNTRSLNVAPKLNVITCVWKTICAIGPEQNRSVSPGAPFPSAHFCANQFADYRNPFRKFINAPAVFMD
ncbi:hypothetical protein RB195_007777 [Necator americanus]|uniref:Uncharacterized protein n=1 Tax=Necator americanus TaxID=51031 RepID=A0ABR1BYX6_NECAM